MPQKSGTKNAPASRQAGAAKAAPRRPMVGAPVRGTMAPRFPSTPSVTQAEKQRREAQAKKDREEKSRPKLTNTGALTLSRANQNLWKSSNVNTWRGVSGGKMKSILAAHKAKLTPEMKRVSNFLLENAQTDPLMTAFAMQYANPFAHYGCRFLGPVENSVGVYTMFRTVDIPINTTNGRFAACLQPKVGSADTLNQWQLMLIDGSAPGWSSGDWTDETNYLVNSPAGDLRVDPNYDSITVTQSAKFSAIQATGIAQVIGAIPASVYTFADGDNMYNLSIDGETDGFTINFPACDPTNVRLWYNYGTSQAANTQINAVTITQTGGVTATQSLSNRLPTTTAAASAAYAFWVGDVALNGTAGTLRFAYAGGTAATTVIGSFAMEVRPLVIDSIDNGAFTSIQPIAAGIWAEWVGPLIENAGNITSALGPVGSVDQNWLSTASTLTKFRPQYWEEYTQLQPGNNSKVYPDGKIDEGAVAMWRPQRPEDQELFKPSVSNATTYGPMYIAGQYNTSSGTIPSGAIVRLFITVTFQYETTNRLLAVASNPLVYANAVPAAENMLHAVGVPIAGPNGFHEWWAQAIKDVGAFFADLGGVVGVIWQNFIGNLKPGGEFPLGPGKIKF